MALNVHEVSRIGVYHDVLPFGLGGADACWDVSLALVLLIHIFRI